MPPEKSLWQCISDCGNLPNIDSGTIKLVEEDLTTFRANATVECVNGYETENETIACLASGTWQSTSCTIKGINYNAMI